MNIQEVFKGLADENRLRILNIVSKYKACVCELEVILELNQANVSRHLSILKSSNLLVATKEAKWIYYSLSEALQKETGLLTFLENNLVNLESCKVDNERLTRYIASEFSGEDVKCRHKDVVKYLEIK
jgi:ArsR family transcriptional regulator